MDRGSSASSRVPARTRRTLWRSTALILAGLLAFLGVGGAALAVGRASLDAAMDQRLDDRREVVRHFYAATDASSGNDTFVRRIRTAPFSPTDAPLNVLPLKGLVSNRHADAIKVRMVVRHDGQIVGQDPADVSIPMDVVEDALAVSHGGGLGLSPVFEIEGDLFWARTYPVGGDDPWGSLVMVEPVTGGSIGGLYRRLRAFTSQEGGMTLLDADGVAAFSWDADRVGTRPYTAEQLDRLTASPRAWTTQEDGGEVVHIGVNDPTRPDGLALVFEQREADLFGDLRTAQRQRDQAVLVVALAALIGLVAFTAVRQRAVRRSEARVELLMRSGHDVVLVVDDDDVLTFVSPAARTMLDQDPADWVARPLTELVADEHVERVEAALERSRQTGEESLLGVRLRSGDGGQVWFDIVFADRGDPNVGGVLVTCSEVGDRKRLEDQLAYQAGHDPLTGLANRVQFEGRLAELAQLDRPFTVMVVDLDRFKQLNDSLGHAAGDTALKAVADSLRAAVRDGDLVGRLGGDEFGVVVPDVTEAVACSVAERVIAGVRSVWPIMEDSPGLDASIGIAMAHGPIHAPELIVRDADAAMYEAKRAGGGQAVTVTVVADEPDPSVRPSAAGGRGPDHAGPAATVQPAAVGRPHHVLPAASARSAATRLRSAAVLVVTVAIVGGVAAVGVVQSSAAQAASEQARIDERGTLLTQMSESIATTTDPDVLRPVVQWTPWNLDSPLVMDFIINIFGDAPVLGTHGMAAALEPDGDVISVHPAGTKVALDFTDERWARALEGESYTPELVHDGEHLRFYLVVPHTTPEGEVDFVVVTGLSPAHSDWGSVPMSLGALGTGRGGFSMVDANGRAIAGFDRDLAGEQVIDPARLRDLERGEVVEHREVVDGEEMVTLITPVPTPSAPRFSLWQQPADDMFGDLRAGQTARDVSVFGLLVMAVIGLAVINRRRERALRRNAARLDALLEQAHDLVVLVRPDGVVSFASAAVHPLFGLAPADVVGRPLADLIGEDVAGGIINATRTAPEAGGRRNTSVRDVEVSGAGGAPRSFDVDGVDLRHQREVGGYLLTFHEISERKGLQDRLTAQATHDSLTGLPNRAQFTYRLDKLAADRRRASGHHAVVFVDLDHFKPVNDQFGHQAGDELLQVIANRLSQAVRSTDVVCRLGGDEFAILLSDCDEEQARETVERLLDAVREPVPVAGSLVSVDASIGVALSRSTITHPEQLVREADQAMYRAKRSGRGRYVVDS